MGQRCSAVPDHGSSGRVRRTQGPAAGGGRGRGRASWLPVLVALLALAASCSLTAVAQAYGPGPQLLDEAGKVAANAEIPIATPSQASGSVVAAVLVNTPVYSTPGGSKQIATLATRTFLTSEPEEAMVIGGAFDAKGKPWVRLELPTRPDLSTGWVDAHDVFLQSDPWYIQVNLSTRQVDVYENGRLMQSALAVVGKPSTPTPGGLYSIYEIVPQSPPDGFLGPFTVQLTAFSNVLKTFDAGPGRVALHGRGGTSLLDPLGSADSHGCVRVDNNVIEWIAANVPLGTAVDID